MTEQPTIQAMVWYKKEDWQELRSYFTDAHLLPEKYEDWLIRAEEALANAQNDGIHVMKVFIDPETFPQWCEKKGCVPDANARTELAIEVAQSPNLSI